jgi:hypothetical protein
MMLLDINPGASAKTTVAGATGAISANQAQGSSIRTVSGLVKVGNKATEARKMVSEEFQQVQDWVVNVSVDIHSRGVDAQDIGNDARKIFTLKSDEDNNGRSVQTRSLKYCGS